jgi:hypothetical protein
VDWFDASLYPDEQEPRRPSGLGERIDYVARVCGAWDFGLLPERETVDELSGAEWREAVDACNMLTSCSYHLLRRIHGLPEAPFLGSIPACIRDDPSLEHV